MFDAFLGRKFYTKCKTNLKLIKIRMEKIIKRRNSVQKFFRADIVDLLKNNLDINAYGRAEGLLVEINMSSCYEMIETFCASVSSNLATMDKQTECPDECREAVPSLMYAAARFADLPELRDLRNLFSTKYGNALDVYFSKEFVEKLKLKPPTKEMKLQLLQEIAHEASIDWDSKVLEQKLYSPPPPEQFRPKYGSFGKEDENECQDDIPVRKMEEKIINDYQFPRIRSEAENKKPQHHGLVPPPPYYSKPKEASSLAASSDIDTFENTINDLHKRSDVETEKPKPKSVRRNRFKQTLSEDNEESPKADFKGDPAILREGKHTRGQSLPDERTPFPRTMQGPTRAESFEPDGMKGIIHPNLPNYDDLASRIASLTGR
ncbi:unnamed protein product [Rhodiola kirilowii]